LNGIDLTPIMNAAAALIAAVLGAFVIPYVNAKTTTQQQKTIQTWVQVAVTAAEQIYQASGSGAEKKAYVLQWLQARGVTVDEAQLNALVEAAVYHLTRGESESE
jgi:antirestriction protein ArdC